MSDLFVTKGVLTPRGQPGRLISGGSADSLLTAAECLRRMDGDTVIEVTVADKVDTLSPQTWPAHCDVVLVGLPVSKPDASSTRRFLMSLKEHGHRLIAVIDEHARQEWETLLDEVGIDIGSLLIEPRSQEHGQYRSAGAVLLDALGQYADAHSSALLDAADACDRRDFWFSQIWYWTNACIKVDIKNNQRRMHLVRHFSRQLTQTDDIRRWVQEYEDKILAHHREIIQDRVDLGHGLVRVTIDGPVDMTVLTYQLYQEPVNARVLMMEGLFFDQEVDGLRRKLALGTDERRLKLFKNLRNAGVHCTGMDHKPFVLLEDEDEAVRVLLELLKAND